MDGHRLFGRVVVQHHDFERSTGAVSGDNKVSCGAGYDMERVTQGGQDVVI